MFTAVALICARNEQIHISRCLGDLISDGIQVLLIDHESTDDTVALARKFLGHGLLDIVSMPWSGTFSLRQQLIFKNQLIQQLDCDWVLHVDADEWLSTPTKDQTLIAGLSEVDAAGWNCVDFNEFVFVPTAEELPLDDYRTSMLTYYFIQHGPHMRAWKRSVGLTNIAGAGHELQGPRVTVYPKPYILRHYIMLNYSQGLQKYRERNFAQEEIDRTWHQDRLAINRESLVLKDHPALQTLPSPFSREFRTNVPVNRHFWQW